MPNDNAPNHYGSKFADRVLHFYQEQRRLRQTVNAQNITGSKDYTFFRMGKSVAQERARGATLTAQNVDMPTVLCTPKEISGLHWVDRQDEKRLTYNQKDELAKSLSMALGRKADGQIISAAYDGETQAQTAGRTALDFSTSDPTLSMLVDIMADLEDRDVPDEGEITVLVTPRTFSHFLLFEAFNNSDWIEMGDRTLGKKTRIRGKHWNGGNIMKHNGLTKAGTGTGRTSDCIAYHETALGHATLDEITTDTASTLPQGLPGTNIYGFIDMDAVAINPDGIQQFKMKDTPTT